MSHSGCPTVPIMRVLKTCSHELVPFWAFFLLFSGKFSGVSGAPTAASTPANDHSDHAVVLSYEGKVSSANDHSAVGIGGDK